MDMVEMEAQENKTMKNVLLIINCIILSIGNCGGPMIMRLYYIHGGKRVWLSSFLQTAGFPVIFITLLIGYLCRKRHDNSIIFIKLPLFVASAIIGVITGLDDYLYVYGLSRLPVSTFVLLTIGAAVLAMHTSEDRPAGESNKEYLIGFFITVMAAALYGFILPLVELVYNKAKQPIVYTLDLEIQLVLCVFASLFCTMGMLINNDFKVIPREARQYELGETKYYVVVVLSAIIWQGFFLGSIGVISCASSLLSGIIIAVLLPATEILVVIFYKEKFQAERGIALVLSLWGFLSYFYGEMKQSKKQRKIHKSETEQS
ncbi:Purine permease-like protein [Quillaja saponaria]|uniref:Probable purine permease n=1 Tax=Quillaja saponaria TaxID=32244 RepID=A0AAD7PA31_QUISA|nr:Purine permease-like protein [Quillaja saponaria]